MLLECDGFSTDTQLCARRHRKRGADAVSACSALNRIHSVKAHELQPVIGLKTVLGQPLSHTNVNLPLYWRPSLATCWYCKIWVTHKLVSASDVTPTDRWLNVWCIWFTFLETLQECRSRRRIGWIIQDFRETCVSRSLTFRVETKMPWRQSPSWKKKCDEKMFINVTRNAYRSRLNAGFQKVCEIFKVCAIESLKYIREFQTPVCYCGDISTPRNVTLNETNCDWLFDMSIKCPHGRDLTWRLKVWLRETTHTQTQIYNI